MMARFSTSIRQGIVWGAALGVAVVLTTQLLTWFGLGLSPLTWISTYILVVAFAVISSANLHMKTNNSAVFLSIILMMTIIILISRIIFQGYMFAYINYVDPDWVENVAAFWEQQLRETGKPEEVVKRTILDFKNQWETKYMFSYGVIRYGAPQFILAIVASMLTVRPWKKRA